MKTVLKITSAALLVVLILVLSLGVYLRSLSLKSYDFASVAASANGQVLASACGYRLKLRSFAGENTKTFTIQGDEIKSMLFSPNGNYLAITHLASPVTILSPKNGSQMKMFEANFCDMCTGLSFSHDSALLAISGFGNNYAVVDICSTKTGKNVKRLKGYYLAAFSGNGILAAAYTSNSYRSKGKHGIDIFERKHAFEIKKSGRSMANEVKYIFCMAFSPNGRFLAIGSRKMSLLEVSSGHELKEMKGCNVRFLQFSHDGKFLAGGDNRQIILWNVESGDIVKSWKHLGVTSVCFDKDGKILTSGGKNGTVKTWKITEITPSKN